MGVGRVGGSLRDPAGYVVRDGRRILRVVRSAGRSDYEAARRAGLLESLADLGLILPATETESPGLGDALEDDCAYVLEHPTIPVVSYPYEWTFAGLQAAALLHVDVHLAALERGFTLKDASAFNVQFLGTRPVFCDVLSFVPYESGALWNGHRQFCEEFLNPLLATAVVGIPFQPWYKGTLTGIAVTDICRLVPKWRMLSLRMLLHVFAHGYLQSRFERAHGTSPEVIRRGRLARPALIRMLTGLRQWISGLRPRHRASVWSRYDECHSYSSGDVERKRAFVDRWIRALRPGTVLDVGCNTGAFSQLALDASARYAVGVDVSQTALDLAFSAAHQQRRAFLPLYVDIANPSPSHGWRGREREAIVDRVGADLVLALAVTHHLVVTKALPVSEVLAGILSLAPHTIIEFVPPHDPLVRQLTALSGRLPEGYDVGSFERGMLHHGHIIDRAIVSTSGRTLYLVARRP